MVISENSSVAEIVKAVPGARNLFDKHGLHGCGGAHGPSERALPRVYVEAQNGVHFDGFAAAQHRAKAPAVKCGHEARS